MSIARCTLVMVRAWSLGGSVDPGPVRSRYAPAAPVLILGLSLYLVNCAAGLAAQLGLVRLGLSHHVLYAFVFASTLAALVFAFHPALLVTVLALAVFPRARPRTFSHPALAVLGLGGYLFALCV